MPKRPKIFPNERIDLLDYTRGSYDFSVESIARRLEQVGLDRVARLLNGFRVEITSATSPAEITVYNGYALGRDGYALNNEESEATSRTVSLVGGPTDFYIQINFALSDTDSDARAFWDPTFDNGGGGVPDGKEFSLNVNTRTVEDWSIDVNTSGFDYDILDSPNNVSFPLCKISTDGAGDILTGPTNPGLVQVVAATNLEYDIASGVTSFRVFDSRLFPDSGASLTVGFGTANAETLTIVSNDKVNNILEVGAPTSNAHSSGAVVKTSGITASFIRERTEAQPDASSGGAVSPSTHPDQARRFWQGDIDRGTALSSSKEIAGENDDLNIRGLKDYVDFMSAQIHRLVYGEGKGVASTEAPPIPADASSPYYQKATSIEGGKAVTLTVGDGVNSLGDVNGATEVALQAAIDAMPAAGGRLYIKRGTYTLANQLVIANKSIDIICDPGTVIDNNSGGTGIALTLGASNRLKLENLELSQSGTDAAMAVTSVSGGQLVFLNCTVVNGVSGSTSTISIVAKDCTFSTNTTGAIFDYGSGLLENCVFDNCSFSGSNFIGNIIGPMSNVSFDACTFTASSGDFSFISLENAACDRIRFSDCIFNCQFALGSTNTADVSNLIIENCVINHESTTVNGSVINLVGDLTNCRISDVRFVSPNFPSSTSVNMGTWLSLQGFSATNKNITNVVVENCYFEGSLSEFIKGMIIADPDGLSQSVAVRDCRFSEVRIGIHVDESPSRLFLENNLIDGGGSSGVGQYGIHFTGSSAFTNVFIRNNRIDDVNGSSVGDVKQAGIYIEPSAAISFNYLTIEGNTVTDIGSSSATEWAAGIMLNDFIDSIYNEINVVRNNVTNVISGAASSSSNGFTYGIASLDLRGFNEDSSTMRIVDNFVNAIGTANGNALGIAVRGENLVSPDMITNLDISSNHIANVSGIDDTGFARYSGGIYVHGALLTNISVLNNQINDVEGDLVNGGLNGCLGVHSTDVANNVIISGNKIWQDNSTIREGSLIELDANTGEANNVVISDNNLEFGSVTDTGIHLVATSAGVFENVTITGNTVGNLTSGSAGGIRIVPGASTILSTNIVVSDNVVLEEVFGSFNIGIHVRRSTNVTISGNTVKGKDGTRNSSSQAGISVDDCEGVSVSGNMVYWAETVGGSSTVQIYVNDTDNCTVNGNQTGTSIGNEIELDGTSSWCFVQGNNVAYGSLAASINDVGTGTNNLIQHNKVS